MLAADVLTHKGSRSFLLHQLLFFSLLVMSDVLQPHGLQHTRLPCSSLSPKVCSDSCPLSWWCHPIISSSVVPFSSYLQSFPASGSFPISPLFVSGGQSIAASASALVLPMYIQGWFFLGLAALISLLYKGERSQIFNYPGVCSTPCQTMSWEPASESVAANSQTFDSNIFALT